MKNGDQPAYPLADGSALGLTKREYFAAIAMQGILSNASFTEQWAAEAMKKEGDQIIDDTLAIRAVQIADSLLAEFEKPTK